MLWQSLSNQWAEVCGLDAEVCCFSSYMDHSNLFPRVCRLPSPLHFFLIPPSAEIAKPASSMWKHLNTAGFSDEGSEGWWKHDLQLCVRRNTGFWVRLIGPRSTWQKLSPEKKCSLRFSPTSPFVKISACWICLTFVRIQNPEIPGWFVFPYTNADALWWA